MGWRGAAIFWVHVLFGRGILNAEPGSGTTVLYQAHGTEGVAWPLTVAPSGGSEPGTSESTRAYVSQTVAGPDSSIARDLSWQWGPTPQGSPVLFLLVVKIWAQWQE